MGEFSKEILNSSKSEMWETPQDFFEELNREFDFNLDPCATPENAKCKTFFTEQDDGLKQSWGGFRVFCNPPYCRKTKLWVKKAYEESLKPGTTVVMLIPSRTDTSYFQDYCLKYGEVRFVRGRLRFGGKDYAPFASAVVIFRNKDKD